LDDQPWNQPQHTGLAKPVRMGITTRFSG
jgi:hypothetical protein